MSHKAIVVSTLLVSAVAIFSVQQTFGGINGVVTDATGSAVPGSAVAVKNVDTNLTVKTTVPNSGIYQVLNLPDGRLEVGEVATAVEVTPTPLLNEVDTASGYVLDSQAINNTPLGTGSFTQLAILSPGLSADFMNTTGSNAGFGNQGQRTARYQQQLPGQRRDRRQHLQREIHQPGGIVAVHLEYRPIERCRRYSDQYLRLRFGWPGNGLLVAG